MVEALTPYCALNTPTLPWRAAISAPVVWLVWLVWCRRSCAERYSCRWSSDLALELVYQTPHHGTRKEQRVAAVVDAIVRDATTRKCQVSDSACGWVIRFVPVGRRFVHA